MNVPGSRPRSSIDLLPGMSLTATFLLLCEAVSLSIWFRKWMCRRFLFQCAVDLWRRELGKYGRRLAVTGRRHRGHWVGSVERVGTLRVGCMISDQT